MQNKTSAENVQLLEGHIEALVKEAISCEVSKDKIFELLFVYWKKEQERILASKEFLKKENARIQEVLSTPVESFIKVAIKQKNSKSNSKYYISKLWNKALEILNSNVSNRELCQFNIFEISCFQLITVAIDNNVSKDQLLEIIDKSWDKIYRIEMLPIESEEEKKFKEKVKKYVQKTSGLFWFINSLDYSRASNPPFVTEKIKSYKMYNWIKKNADTKSVPAGMYWYLLEKKYEPVIPVITSVAEEILWAIKCIYQSNGGEKIKPEKIISQSMKRMGKIYSRWDENIKEDIRVFIKLLRLYIHEVKASDECQKAVESMATLNSTYFDKAIIRVIWEIEHN